jgi:hypothetical protein
MFIPLAAVDLSSPPKAQRSCDLVIKACIDRARAAPWRSQPNPNVLHPDLTDRPLVVSSMFRGKLKYRFG